MIDPTLDELINASEFISRHLGPSHADEHAMLQALGLGTTAELIDQVVPAPIRMQRDLDLPPPIG
ncbi:MAG: hypothetical protein LJE97_20355, partial [Betaproteobacteria bacterium]|nr:hypothetical protein [Betaproteobacteria bacterium]